MRERRSTYKADPKVRFVEYAKREILYRRTTYRKVARALGEEHTRVYRIIKGERKNNLKKGQVKKAAEELGWSWHTLTHKKMNDGKSADYDLRSVHPCFLNRLMDDALQKGDGGTIYKTRAFVATTLAAEFFASGIPAEVSVFQDTRAVITFPKIAEFYVDITSEKNVAIVLNLMVNGKVASQINYGRGAFEELDKFLAVNYISKEKYEYENRQWYSPTRFHADKKDNGDGGGSRVRTHEAHTDELP